MTSEQSHVEDHEAHVLVRARSSGQAEELCKRLVEDALALDADAAWVGRDLTLCCSREASRSTSCTAWRHRLMYGERDNPYAVLSRLGRRLGLLRRSCAAPPFQVRSAVKQRLQRVNASRKEAEGWLRAMTGSPTLTST
jgi:hypothetical protein